MPLPEDAEVKPFEANGTRCSDMRAAVELEGLQRSNPVVI